MDRGKTGFGFYFLNHFVREATPLNPYGNPDNWARELFSEMRKEILRELEDRPDHGPDKQ